MYIDPWLRQTITGLIEDVELKRNKEGENDKTYYKDFLLIRTDIGRILEVLYENCNEDEITILDSIFINGVKNLLFTCNIPEPQFKEDTTDGEDTLRKDIIRNIKCGLI